MVALLIVNHKAFPKAALALGGIVIFMLLLITLLMMASASEYNEIFRSLSDYALPDWYGALGGFFFGLFSGLWIMPAKRPMRVAPPKSEKLIKLVGMGMTFVWLAIFIPVFFFAVDRPGYFSR